MRKLLFAVTILCSLLSFSQSKDFKISGKIVAEEDNSPLEAATVYLERKRTVVLFLILFQIKKFSIRR